eukprot:CAMPEP_0119395532 /NCGR_PEP_ID=MMETSP1334-20130426/133635_1 /TAXON_ID=127549 /ORGANISM="Calcidiscus leptoporus, Strain RCC1130" /LENGTH=47 /DNA_ID= /DNA_START= /DNA_END= /DNA_ORIENTATION=
MIPDVVAADFEHLELGQHAAVEGSSEGRGARVAQHVTCQVESPQPRQ